MNQLCPASIFEIDGTKKIGTYASNYWFQSKPYRAFFSQKMLVEKSKNENNNYFTIQSSPTVFKANAVSVAKHYNQ